MEGNGRQAVRAHVDACIIQPATPAWDIFAGLFQGVQHLPAHRIDIAQRPTEPGFNRLHLQSLSGTEAAYHFGCVLVSSVNRIIHGLHFGSRYLASQTVHRGLYLGVQLQRVVAK
jgi:hypothetical protein